MAPGRFSPVRFNEASKMDAKNTKLRLGLLVAFHLVAMFLVTLWFRSLVSFGVSYWYGDAFWFVRDLERSLFLSQVCLLGIWIGLGTCAWEWRLASFVFGFIWISGIAVHTYHYNPWFLFLVISFPMLVCRVLVARPEFPDSSKTKCPPGKFQYSIFPMVILTTIVVISLATLK